MPNGISSHKDSRKLSFENTLLLLNIAVQRAMLGSRGHAIRIVSINVEAVGDSELDALSTTTRWNVFGIAAPRAPKPD